MSYSSVVLATSGLRAYYRFQESSGQPQDSSGNGNHTTAKLGSMTYAQAGAISTDAASKSVLFDFTDNQYFTAPDSATLDCADVVSIECWYKPVFTGAGQTVILAKGNGAYGLDIVTNKIRIANDGNSGLARSNQDISNTALWYYVLGVKSGATKKMYINAVDDSVAVATSTLVDTSNVLYIGSDTINFGGYLAELAIYGADISSQASAHYAAAFAEKQSFYAFRRRATR